MSGRSTRDETVTIERALDFRIGGRERLRGTMAGGPVSMFDAIYYDVELAAARRGRDPLTRLRFAEQAALLDAWDDAGNRQRGTSELLVQLAESLAQG